MTEVLATGSAIVSIAAVALHSARLLRDDVRTIQSAEETVGSIIEDLDSIIEILSSLDEAAGSQAIDRGALREIDNENVRNAAGNCNKICTEFQNKLGRWMKHSSKDKMDWREKLRVLGEKEILEFRGQLVACKGTFTIALQLATT